LFFFFFLYSQKRSEEEAIARVCSYIFFLNIAKPHARYSPKYPVLLLFNFSIEKKKSAISQSNGDDESRSAGFILCYNPAASWAPLYTDARKGTTILPKI
jgi:hypothetical protein